MKRARSVIGIAGLLLLGLIKPGVAAADDYPTRPISIVTANGPGDDADLTARILAPEMSKMLGQPVIVLNKPGAGGLLGADYIARVAPADGYTIGSMSINALLVLPLTTKNVQFDPLKDVPPFIDTTTTRLLLISPNQQPWQDFDGMIAYAKANPGKLNYGSSSSTTHLLTELLLRARKVNVVYVPYSSTSANLNGMLGGDTQVEITTEGEVRGTLDRVKVLAQTGSARSSNFPNVPTFTELGFPQMPGASYSFNMRQGTPKTIIGKLQAVVAKILREPEMKAAMAKLNAEISPPQPPAEIVADQAKLARTFKDIAEQIGLKPE